MHSLVHARLVILVTLLLVAGLVGTASGAPGDPLVLGSTANDAGATATAASAAPTGSVPAFQLTATGTGTGAALRVLAQHAGAGVHATTNDPGRFALVGANVAGATGPGGALQALGQLNHGVVATTEAATRQAVSAASSAPGGTAVLGQATSTTGATTGILGQATASATGTGVWGEGGQFGVFSQGDLGADRDLLFTPGAGTHRVGTTGDEALELFVNLGRALRLEPAPASPNLIGGHPANSVSSGVSGATIGGGGTASWLNRVTADFGTVGGGLRNKAGGGATVGGGRNNTASGPFATVPGGRGNTAGGNKSTIGGGEDNIAVGLHATIGGGDHNYASGWDATVGGGSYNSARGRSATVGGGDTNSASGEGATVPGGLSASASLFGQMAHAAGFFGPGSPGNAQASEYVLRRETAGTTPGELFLDELSLRLTVASGRTLTFEAQVVGRSSEGASAGYRVDGVIENVAGTTSFVGTPTVITLGEDVSSWSVTAVADDTNDALAFTAAGSDGLTVRWVAVVRTTEVAW